MTLSIFLKSLFASLCWHSGLALRLLRRNASRGFVILTYHRVIPKEMAAKGVQPGMYVTPETFAMHAEFLAEEFKVVPLREIYETLRSGRKVEAGNGRPICVLTFDDGWSDFHIHAFPVLKNYNLPATVFLPTDYIGTDKWFWTDRIGYLLYQSRKSANASKGVYQGGNELVKRVIGLRGSVEETIESAIGLLKAYAEEEIGVVIDELSRFWGISPVPEGRAFLTWDEVREIAGSGLVSFGSHTASHRILTALHRHEIEDEVIRSRERLIVHGIADASFLSFCYPNGNFNESVIEAVKSAGFHVGLTTASGWNSEDLNLFKLRRISLHEDMSKTRGMYAARLALLI